MKLKYQAGASGFLMICSIKWKTLKFFSTFLTVKMEPYLSFSELWKSIDK